VLRLFCKYLKIFFHGSNVDGLKNHFPADILPKEYGGTGESIEVLSGMY
jgi:hypothetical protein